MDDLENIAIEDDADLQLSGLWDDHEELLDTLKDIVKEYCFSQEGEVIASTLRPAGVTGLLVLAKHGRVVIKSVGGHRIEGTWV